MAMSIADDIAIQSSGACVSKSRQCRIVSPFWPNAAACTAHRLARSAAIGTHFVPNAPPSSSSAFSPFPHSLSTLA